MKYKYILWDWNGTLLDDVEASLDAVNDMLKMYGKQAIDINAYYSYVDTPIYKFYERIFDLEKVPMSVIKPLFGELYAKHDGKVLLSAGAEKILGKCRQNGVKQYIISAANVDDLMHYAVKLNVCSYFERIEAAKDREAGSKIERAKMLMREEGIAAEECVMIGDTVHDHETATALGVSCILYSKGHTDYDTLKNTGALVCSSFDEIAEVLE